MGCCSSGYEIISLKPEVFFNDLINKTLTHRFQSYGIENLSNFDKDNIDKILIQIGSVQTNALGMSILLGDAKLMKYLIENFHADFSILEEQLQYQNLTLTEFLILNFNSEIFRFTLPFFVKNESEQEIFQLDDTIQFVSLCIPKPKKKVHPMWYAAEIGNLAFISFICSTYNNKVPPECFNIHAVDEDTGENCALIACAHGHLDLIAFLHKNGCDFKRKNNKNETAINLALANLDQDDFKVLMNVLVYLIEQIRLDVTENYEESLLLCLRREVSEYIEERLKLCGVDATKRIVDSKFENSFSFEKVNQDSDYNITSLPSLISSIEQFDLSNDGN